MNRDKLTRYGCDMCKCLKGTYVFDHFGEIKIWICEVCLAHLLEWNEVRPATKGDSREDI